MALPEGVPLRPARVAPAGLQAAPPARTDPRGPFVIDAILVTIITVTTLSGLLVIGNIGKPRTPTTPGTAVLATLVNATIITGLIYVMVSR